MTEQTLRDLVDQLNLYARPARGASEPATAEDIDNLVMHITRVLNAIIDELYKK